jgi:4-hydroxybenzoate polyprenyltransferase
LVLISQSEDYPEDKSAGLKTPPVAWGLKKALRVSLNLNIFGSICSLIAFTLFFFLSNIFLLTLLPLFVVALFHPTMSIYHLNLYSRKTSSQTEILEEIRKFMPDYPKWHGIPLGAIMLFSLILLVVRSI